MQGNRVETGSHQTAPSANFPESGFSADYEDRT